MSPTGIRQTAPGGKARAFCDIVGDQLGQLETSAYLNLAQTLLPYATGAALDYLGAIYGVARIPQADATTAAEEQNFRFYVRRGTFGAINGGADIRVPAGMTRSLSRSAPRTRAPDRPRKRGADALSRCGPARQQK